MRYDGAMSRRVAPARFLTETERESIAAQAVRNRLAYLAQSTIIYFAGDDPTEPIKIGRTVDIPRRMTELRAEFRRPRLVALATMPGTVNEERSLHELFAGQAKGREWFYPSAELLGLIESVKRAGYDAMRCPPVRGVAEKIH